MIFEMRVTAVMAWVAVDGSDASVHRAQLKQGYGVGAAGADV